MKSKPSAYQFNSACICTGCTHIAMETGELRREDYRVKPVKFDAARIPLDACTALGEPVCRYSPSDVPNGFTCDECGDEFDSEGNRVS